MHLLYVLQYKAHCSVIQQLVRFVIEQYREELITSLQGNVDEHRIAEDREVVARDLLNILHRLVYCQLHIGLRLLKFDP